MEALKLATLPPSPHAWSGPPHVDTAYEENCEVFRIGPALFFQLDTYTDSQRERNRTLQICLVPDARFFRTPSAVVLRRLNPVPTTGDVDRTLHRKHNTTQPKRTFWTARTDVNDRDPALGLLTCLARFRFPRFSATRTAKGTHTAVLSTGRFTRRILFCFCFLFILRVTSISSK